MSPNNNAPRLWLRRADQATVAVLTLFSLGAIAAYWWAHGGHRGRLIEIDRAPPLKAEFRVDVNQADWPELAQLPGLGETLARRVVESRQRDGLFLGHDDLRRVRGIGPKTVDGLRPYLLPLPPSGTVAASETGERSTNGAAQP